ncbi:hypothetical protein LBMAG48_06300 [Phycisphaerae bacterium]|nr:hypothetical protein LBMAG48_06300 [Phycisphaerae bacterium]
MTTNNTDSTKKPSKTKKILLFGGGGTLLALAGLGVFAPSIAGGLAPGIIREQAGKFVSGKVDVSDVSLSWGGPQRIAGVTLVDASGATVAKASVETSAGLWGLATGGLDLGEVTIRDTSLALVRYEDGTTNLQKMMVKPAAQPAPQPAPGAGQPGAGAKDAAKVPPGLKVRVKITNVNVTLEDQAGPGGKSQPTKVELKNVNGSAVLDPAKPLELKLTADTTGGGGTGKVSADITANNWANAQGVITTDVASVDAKIDIASLPIALLDALAGPIVKDETGKAVPLARALGAQLNAQINAKGTLKDATANINIAAERINVVGDIRLADNVATTPSGLTINAKAAALSDLVPALKAATSNPQAKIDTLPDATVKVADLRMTLPKDGKPMSFAGAAATLTIDTTQITGNVSLGEGQPMQAMTIAPMRISVASSDFAKDLRITGGTSATLAGQQAGTFAIDATLAGLLDNAGAFKKGMPSNINASVKATQIATAIAQPFVAAWRLDLPRDVGPVLNLDLSAKTTAAGGDTINIDFTADAQSLKARGALAYSPTLIATREFATGGGSGIVIEAARAGRIAEALTQTTGDWLISPDTGEGALRVNIIYLNLPMGANGPELARAGAQANFETSGVRATKRGSNDPININTLKVAVRLDAGLTSIASQGVMNFRGQQFNLGTGFDVPGMLVANKPVKAEDKAWAIAEPITLRPVGGLEIVGLPTGLAQLFMQPPTDGSLDVARLMQDIAGPAMTVRVTSAKDPADASALLLDILADSGAIKVNAQASANDKRIALASATAQTTLTPQSFATLLDTFAKEMADKPRLDAPATATLTLKPMTIPLDANRKPKFGEAGLVAGTLAIAGDAFVSNVSAGEGQKARVGTRGLEIEFEAPASSLVAPDQGGKAGQAKATLRGSLLGAQANALAQLSGTLGATLSAAKPTGTANANITLASIDTRGVENLLNKTGLLSGALGDTAQVCINANYAFDTTNADVQLTLAAPNVTTTGPITLRALADRFELAQPANIRVNAQPAFVNALLTPAPVPGEAAKPPAMTMTQPAMIDIALTRLLLPRAKDGQKSTLAPDAALRLTVPTMALRTSDNKTLALRGVNVSLDSDKSSTTDRPLNFAATIDDAQVDGAAGSGKVGLTGRVTQLLDSNGAFSMERALADAKGNMPTVPTAVVDALANQDGLLVEALGPLVQLDLDVQRYPLGGKPVAGAQPGIIKANLVSERATAKIEGNIDDAVLVTSQPVAVDIFEITNALSGKFVKGLPLIGSFEKGKKDVPATLRGNNLRIPLDKNYAKLNGVVTFDPGEARFGTSGVFGELINVAGLRTGGVIGQRLEPLTVTVQNGVATYPKWRLPLGEFVIETEGTVDLVNRQVDVVTWIPLGALTDKAAGVFNTGIGGTLDKIGLDRMSTLPFRTRGSMDKPETNADLELFGKQTIKNINPGNLINDLLKGIGGKKEEKK